MNWEVIAMVRKIPVAEKSNVVYASYNLSQPVDESFFQKADYLIHCAFVKNEISPNVEGAKNILNISRKYGIIKNIFLSSFSAKDSALSNYGKQKVAVEKLFNSEKDCVIRAGVVLGNGGLFKQMNDYLILGKIIPLIGSGKQPLQTILIDDLILVIEKVISENLNGRFSVADPVPVLYKDFFSTLSELQGRKPRFISIPVSFLNALLFFSELFHIPLPVSRENVLGLKSMERVETENDLRKINVTLKNFRESILFLMQREKKKN